MLEYIKNLMSTALFWSAFAAISATLINILLYSLNRSTFKLLYDKPKVNILESFASPGNFPSKIVLSIFNPSNFENTICCVSLLNLKSLHLPKIVVKKEIDIKLPATSKIKFETELNFEDVKDLRGHSTILVLTDLKGNDMSKRFKFMPSYNLSKVKKAMKG